VGASFQLLVPGDRGWVKVKNGNYWRLPEERELPTRRRERQSASLSGRRG
jgi:hypothetical protein